MWTRRKHGRGWCAGGVTALLILWAWQSWQPGGPIPVPVSGDPSPGTGVARPAGDAGDATGPGPTTGRTSPVTGTAMTGGPPTGPFPVTWEGRRFAWAGGDCTHPERLQQLARNPREYERLLEENTRIDRRQLVYIKHPAALLVQQAQKEGRPVRRLLLPDLDGRELEVEVERTDLEPSGQAGALIGRLVGQPDSLVTLAFELGREAFTVMAPSAGLYLQGHPREPGELFVTRFRLETYLPLPCGSPILTDP